jgi:hypothetical protein
MRLLHKPGRIWLLLAAVGLLVFAALPVSNRVTRSCTVGLLLVAWGFWVAFSWRRTATRMLSITATVAMGVFLCLPARHAAKAETLRQDYAAALRRYQGIRYFWGGEGFTGIDCSGLVRRGLIDAALARGIRCVDPGLIRYAVWLWWHDCAATDLGEGRSGLTAFQFETPSVNVLDCSRLLLGDLAVTRGGEHVMAYIGSNKWIEADPAVGRVITVQAPSADNPWFQLPMRVVRWTVLGSAAP